MNYQGKIVRFKPNNGHWNPHPYKVLFQKQDQLFLERIDSESFTRARKNQVILQEDFPRLKPGDTRDHRGELWTVEKVHEGRLLVDMSYKSSGLSKTFHISEVLKMGEVAEPEWD